MKLSSAILGGLAGATALTLLHETVRRINPDAPRMDRLGMDAISKILKSANTSVPDENSLFYITMAGDVVSNSLYYSLAGFGKEDKVIIRAALLGLAAGIGGVYLPKPLGLIQAPSSRTTQTKLLTVTWYFVGGLVAGVTQKLLNSKSQN